MRLHAYSNRKGYIRPRTFVFGLDLLAGGHFVKVVPPVDGHAEKNMCVVFMQAYVLRMHARNARAYVYAIMAMYY